MHLIHPPDTSEASSRLDGGDPNDSIDGAPRVLQTTTCYFISPSIST